jgi:hypothetical protein
MEDYVGFVGDRVELRQVFAECFGFPLPNIITPLIHTRLQNIIPVVNSLMTISRGSTQSLPTPIMWL